MCLNLTSISWRRCSLCLWHFWVSICTNQLISVSWCKAHTHLYLSQALLKVMTHRQRYFPFPGWDDLCNGLFLLCYLCQQYNRLVLLICEHLPAVGGFPLDWHSPGHLLRKWKGSLIDSWAILWGVIMFVSAFHGSFQHCSPMAAISSCLRFPYLSFSLLSSSLNLLIVKYYHTMY